MGGFSIVSRMTLATNNFEKAPNAGIVYKYKLILFTIITFSGLYYDGKIDKALARSEAGGNTLQSKDDYSVVLHYPDRRHEKKQEGTYGGFFVPENSTGTVPYIVVLLT